VLCWRLVDLQVVRREEFVKRARRQQERTVELPPRRGAIVDAEGRPLAITREVDSVFAIPSDVEDPDGTARALAPVLGLRVADLAKKLKAPEKDFVWLARRIDAPVAAAIAARKIPGIRLLKESTRKYPQGPLAASIVGYVGLDNQGLAGLEHRFEDEVRGRPARVTFLRDAAQRSYAEAGKAGSESARAALAEGVEGVSLVLTIDAAIQHVAERELAKGAEAYHAKAGSAVVLDPWSGAILAVASYPNFDPNRYSEFDAETRRCRPIADAYEPGSTFKVITASAALDAGTIAPDDVIDCGGGSLTIGRVTIHEHGHNRWFLLPLSDVLAHSSNIGAAHVGLGLGRGPFYKAVRGFGFGQRTGVELPGETSGILSDVQSWSALTLPTMSFGQEIGVTVLQMARAYAAVANGGVLPAPHLVSEMRLPDGRVRRAPQKPFRRVISGDTAREMRRLMARVVEVGTGKLAAIPGFTVAGKTGTAQKAAPGGGYARDKFVASFIGFTPAESPRIVIAVVLDEPKGKIFGGDVAAPVFSAIGSATLELLREPVPPSDKLPVPPVFTADLATATRDATAVVLSRDVVPASMRTEREAAPGTVPDVVGKSAREAVRLLSAAGLAVRLEGHGFVVAQDPPPGAAIEPGISATLSLSLDPRPAETMAAATRAALETIP
jgi:cell division protein FtsI (penicillin-binding protein 3)